MTSGAPAPTHASPPQEPAPPAAAAAASPQNKRDLKSWWKGFKLPSKHQETSGRVSPSSGFWDALAHTSKDDDSRMVVSLFKEDEHHVASQIPNYLLAQHDQHVGAIAPAVPPALSNVATSDATVMTRKDFSISQLSKRICSCFADPVDTESAGIPFRPAPSRRRRLTKRNKAGSKPQGIFGVPLRQSITYANVAISLIDENGSSYIYGYVPIVVAKCGVFLKEKATEIEGIFRLSGSEKRIKELKTVFDSPDRYGKGLVWDGYTVHDASNVFRRYLNDLPEPVVPLDLYEKFREPLRGAIKPGTGGDAEGPQFVEDFDERAAIARYQQLITELPPLNRQLLLYILDLLAVFAAKSDLNRMNSQNLAAIFQPGMLSHPNHAMAPEEYRLNQCVLIFLIENQDHFLIGMQGTAADEQTRQEVETGTSGGAAGANAPATPAAQRTPGLGRSASNASAGAESVRRDGMIRRNRSTSSRHSRHEGGTTTPGSPALATTPTGGLARSNTVPSKKSPALPSGRFAMEPSPVTSRQANFTTNPDDLGSTSDRSTIVPAAVGASALSPGPANSGAGRSQERLLEPPEAVSTPIRERNLQSLFQRSPTSDAGRPRNKLKKRIPGSMNQSAQSSTASLPQSAAASPSVEVVNPIDQQVAEHHPKLDKVPAATAQHNSAEDTSSEPTPRVSHMPSNTLHPDSTLKGKKSPPTSLHSSFNEGSDIDHVDGSLNSVPTAEQQEKEKKKRWRLSRSTKKEETGHHQAPLASPTPTGLGSNSNAETSTTSVGSNGRSRQSFAHEGSDIALSTAEGQLSHDSSMKEKDGKDDPKGPIGWIRNKYREAKENHGRNKSPPAGDNRHQAIGSSGFLPNRGKSMDVKREDEKSVQHGAAAPLPPQPTQDPLPTPHQQQEPLESEPQPQPQPQPQLQPQIQSQPQPQVQPTTGSKPE